MKTPLLSTMDLNELLKYAELPPELTNALENFIEELEEAQTENANSEYKISRLESELTNYKLFVASMYKEVNAQTTYKGLKAAINDELDFYGIEL